MPIINTSWADRYIGIPFLDSDEPSYNGTNCWGLVRLIYQEQLKIELPSLKIQYCSSFDPQAISVVIREQIEKHWPQVERHQPFDVIVTRYMRAESHVGIMIDRQNFIHTHEGTEKSPGFSQVENFSSPKWNRRVIGFYHYAR